MGFDRVVQLDAPEPRHEVEGVFDVRANSFELLVVQVTAVSGPDDLEEMLGL
jgi:hypothetical protein